MACIELILNFVKNSFTYEKLISDTLFLPLGLALLAFEISDKRLSEIFGF